MKSGFVAIVGRPNVGKSTLINNIVGSKIAITSNKPQTTRNIIQGVYNEKDVQIIFVDTPGIHKPKHKLGEYLNRQAYYSINDVDVVVMLVDVSEKIGPGDKFIIDSLKKVDKPVILVLNKIDILKREELLPIIDEYKKLHDFAEIVPVSALKKDNINRFIEVLKKYLNDDIKYYPDEQITNRSTEFLIAEIIREKVLHLTEEEIPHSITCVIEQIKKEKNKYIINAVIVVERDSIKKIIIGKQGQMIKKIGTLARKEIEALLNSKVYLELFVKTVKNWREKERYLKEFGFTNFE
ncbi:MAG: GTPase Era [Mollicutes bacterium]|nr:GTPase Era [Mollicutes bacterium]